MAQERLQAEENKSVWDSRFFKAGAVAVAVGVLINSAVFLGIGAVAMGGAWAANK